MKYNDLRDYHNNKFIIERLQEILGLYGANAANCYLSFLGGSVLTFPIYIFNTIVYNYIFVTNNKISVQKELNLINKNETLKLRKQIYDDILKNISEHFKDTVAIDPVTINKYICYVINKGYLSLNKKFTIKNVRDFDQNFAYNILRGVGVCRNVTYLTTDIFKSLGFDAYDLIMCNSFDKTKLHAITMVLYNDKLYFFDNLNKATYTKLACILRHDTNSQFYLPAFYLEKDDEIYKILSYVCKDRSPFLETKKIFDTYKQEKYKNYTCINYPKELKKIYSNNKKRYKEFIKTYY